MTQFSLFFFYFKECREQKEMSINYDFIIVGGGASGSVLASVLATKGPTLLIERGVNHTSYPQSTVRQGWPQIAVVAFEQFQNNGSGHWTGTPDILGGGTALNGAVCWRGEASIFESLGFDIQSVQSTFEHLEGRLCLRNDDANTEFMQAFQGSWEEHGYEAVTSSSLSGYFSSWIKPLKNKSKTIKLGRTILPVFSDRRPSSHIFEAPYNNSKTIPDSSGDFMVESDEQPSILNQGNLTVYLMTKAKRVLFNNEKVAIGVDIHSPAGDASVYVREGGKIFLNAGAYETPKLLMLSGIGPVDTLRTHGIPPVHLNQAVGQNLIDRKEFPALIPLFQNMDGDDVAMIDFAAFNDKYWAAVAHKFASAWGNPLGGCGSCAPVDRNPECHKQLAGALTFYGMGRESNVVPYFIFHRRPITRGNLTLASAKFNDHPVVHDGWSMNYENLGKDALRDLEDITDGVEELLIDMLRNTTLLERLGHHSLPSDTSSGEQVIRKGDFDDEIIAILEERRASFDSLSEELNKCQFSSSFVDSDTSLCKSWDECVPTIPSLPYKNRRKLQEIVFNGLSSSYHMAGTCQANTVVEKETLSVIGVEGLYISDLSVLTQPVDANPMLTAMSIGHLVGLSIESVPSSQYEITPLVIAATCTLVIATILCGWLFKRSFLWFPTTANKKRNKEKTKSKHQYNNDSKTTNIEEVSSSPAGATVLDIWGQEQTNDMYSLSHRSSTRHSDSFHDHPHPDTTATSKEQQVDGQRQHEDHLMRWSNVSCSYPKKKKSMSSSTTTTTTLFKSFGTMKEGEVTAIMGPSGASKSTLLDIISGRKSVGAVSGTFSVLERSLFSVAEEEGGLTKVAKAIQGVSAYIPQQEYFYPTQTCEEAINFTATMKFGKADPRERHKAVRACLEVVGLEPDLYARRKIGGELAGGVTIRGLSGGERKRLALACVLALRPRMLFIDELTSGLDSENAYLIMKLLKELSVKMHVATLIIIHQPSPDVFALFDRLVLLSKGRCLFSDYCSNLSTFYETNYNETLPVKTAIADDLLVKASVYDLSNEEDGSGFYKCENNTVDTPPLSNDDEVGRTEIFEYNLPKKAKQPSNKNTETKNATEISSRVTTPMEQTFFRLWTIFHRNLWNQYVRNITNVGVRLLSYSGLAVIVGMVFWRVGSSSSPDHSSSERGLTFEEANLVLRACLYLMNISYLLPFASISVFFADKKFFAAESALGLYPTWMYVVSQVVLEFLFLTLTAIVEAAIVIPMVGLINPVVPPLVNFFTIACILILSGLVGSTMIFCCSIWLPTQDLAFLLGSTLVTISLSLSGGFLPFTDMSDVPHAIQWLSPVKYSFQALVIALLKGTSAEKVIELGGYDTPKSVTGNIGFLSAIFLTVTILTAIGMTRVKEVR